MDRRAFVRMLAAEKNRVQFLASALTSNPNEFPAIWCLFSVGIIVIGLSPWIRQRVRASRALTIRMS